MPFPPTDRVKKNSLILGRTHSTYFFNFSPNSHSWTECIAFHSFSPQPHPPPKKKLLSPGPTTFFLNSSTSPALPSSSSSLYKLIVFSRYARAVYNANAPHPSKKKLPTTPFSFPVPVTSGVSLMNGVPHFFCSLFCLPFYSHAPPPLPHPLPSSPSLRFL